MLSSSLIRFAFTALLILTGGEFSTAQIAATNSSYVKEASSFDKFTPQPQKKTRIDYEVWDSLLEELVLYTGPSTRISMPRPAPVTGSRFVRGHTSAYRLEGNRIPYSQINSSFETLITDYRKDLERVGTNMDIAKLSKNEQLAFWLNLHNTVIIEQLAKEYPVRQPKKLKIGKDKMPLHDAKIIEIGNMKLSLRDIREKIVYPNWQNPKVIYGFYLGDIGSPSIQNTAFTANNISNVLDRSAAEFVNSLRGFRIRNDQQYISQLYTDVAKFYFPDFNADVRNHIIKFMRDDVKKQMLNNTSFRTGRYETIIADLTAGQGEYESISQLETTSRTTISLRNSNPIQKYLQELIEKRQRLERLGLVRNGTVIIEDIQTNDTEDIIKPDIDIEP